MNDIIKIIGGLTIVALVPISAFWIWADWVIIPKLFYTDLTIGFCCYIFDNDKP